MTVGPTNSGPVVTQGIAGFDTSGIAAVAGATAPQTGGSGLSFTYTPIPDNLLVTSAWPPVVQSGAIVNRGTGFQTACPPGETGYYVYDSSGSFAGVLCVPATTTGTSGELALAQQASSRQAWPRLTVGVNPDRGLTGLASWFWLTPPNATMAPASATAGPLTVTVRASLIDVLWDFGDGNRTDSGLSLGLAYPRQSTISHVYQTDTYQQPGGYQAGATLRFGVWYSVNAGPWRFLGTKARSYALSYAVNQIQPEGVPVSP
ncbi:MAG: hypothetical protein M3077_05920 [Candidatus Dormibacteraeota bacterium]|nr:hypothetical protein [Candidatus Dormibacteraeota bacterium]